MSKPPISTACQTGDKFAEIEKIWDEYNGMISSEPPYIAGVLRDAPPREEWQNRREVLREKFLKLAGHDCIDTSHPQKEFLPVEVFIETYTIGGCIMLVEEPELSLVADEIENRRLDEEHRLRWGE